MTVSVPDGLHEKMRNWRDSINYSKEFQRHISKLIEKKEELKNLTKGDKHMAEIIQRLREEKMETIGDHEEMGFKDGYEWAEDAHYSDIQEVLDWDTEKDYPDNEWLLELIRTRIQEDEFMDWNDLASEQHNEYNEKYLKGVKKGILAFWEKVKELI